MAACQSAKACNYWTLDTIANICELKYDDTGKVPSDYAISGSKMCDDYQSQEEFWCTGKACAATLNIEERCSDEMTVEFLEGDYHDSNEDVAVVLNDGK
eukprot:TRINITY_DN1950_c0_g1_i1.p1 TRINITY_DN1950_c0_g1~~TRINITY_DN1950_c0_g1_i1.p1  ORF type:complete len:114 (-),score=11.81 TRINITY_DN1950_c0_g1_i1:212-508(-)